MTTTVSNKHLEYSNAYKTIILQKKMGKRHEHKGKYM